MSAVPSGILPTPTPNISSTKALKLPTPETAEQNFQEYMEMSPAERMFSAMLSQLGLTKDQFDAMDSKDKQAVEQKIQQMIKQQAQSNDDKRTGLIADISV